MVLLALEPVGCVAEIVDRGLQLVADLLVGGDACRQRDGAAAADQLVVELTSCPERAHHVVAQLLVRHRPLNVGFDVPCCVVDLVLRLGHARWILSPRYRAPDTPGTPMQTGSPVGSADSLSLRGVGGDEGAAVVVGDGDGAGIPLSGAQGLEGPGGGQARDGDARALVQVSAYPLVRAYSDALFAKVAPELRLRMNDLAQQTGGQVTGTRTVTAAGSKSHAYDVTSADHVDEYTFVLRGKREYLLLCRRAPKDDRAYCAQLVTSFAA